MTLICSLFAKNLRGSEDGNRLYQIPTELDEKLALAANSFLCRRAEVMTGTCGWKGEPTCEELREMARAAEKKVILLVKERNAFLQRSEQSCQNCLITPEELAKIHVDWKA
ncbi:MAG: hypothetical protein K0S74_815 [Chlamydiales bacterium]|jgi:hypothetical protein|nr:hypothetical protein [Chlamydiales bacterium]